MPKSFFFLPSLEKISRSPIGFVHANDPYAVAYAIPRIQTESFILPGVINFYDMSLGSPDIKFRLETAIHELAHHLDFTEEIRSGIRISHRIEFLKLSDWQKSEAAPKGWVPNSKHQFVTTYSKTKPEEDFADAASYYVINSDYLLKTDPAKYQFLKENVFFGLEYANEDSKLKSRSDDEVMRNCLGKIKSIVISKKDSLKIGTFDKKDFYFYSQLEQRGSSYSLRQLDCVPEPNAEVGGLNFCDIGGTKDLKFAIYSGVLKSLNSLLDQIINSWFNMEETKSDCVDANDFTALCRLKKMPLPPGVEFDEVFGKIVTFVDSFSSRDFLTELTNKLPIPKIELSCLNEHLDKIGIQNGFVIVHYKKAENDSWYWYSSIRPTCGPDTVKLLESEGFKLDRPIETLGEVAHTDIAMAFQKGIFDTILKSSSDCRLLFNRLDKSCMAKKLQLYFEAAPLKNRPSEKQIQDFSLKIDLY